MLLQRYIRDGHLPVAFARLIAMLILSVSYWAANFLALFAIRDPIVLDWSQGAFAIQIVSARQRRCSWSWSARRARRGTQALRPADPRLLPDYERHAPLRFRERRGRTALAERLPPIALASVVGLLPVIAGVGLLNIRDATRPKVVLPSAIPSVAGAAADHDLSHRGTAPAPSPSRRTTRCLVDGDRRSLRSHRRRSRHRLPAARVGALRRPSSRTGAAERFLARASRRVVELGRRHRHPGAHPRCIRSPYADPRVCRSIAGVRLLRMSDTVRDRLMTLFLRSLERPRELVRGSCVRGPRDRLGSQRTPPVQSRGRSRHRRHRRRRAIDDRPPRAGRGRGPSPALSRTLRAGAHAHGGE